MLARSTVTAPADPAETAIVPDEEGSGRGHIGLIVLCSIAFGLILGLVLVLGVFGGGRENVITGAALVSLALGMLMLFELARRRTDQPQPWALAPAVGLGVVGLAAPRSRAGRSHAGLARLGVAASARGTRRVVVAWCAPLASQLVAASAALSVLRHLGIGRPWRSIRDHLRGDDE